MHLSTKIGMISVIVFVCCIIVTKFYEDTYGDHPWWLACLGISSIVAVIGSLIATIATN